MADLTWTHKEYAVRSGSDPIEYHTFIWPNDDLIEHIPEDFSCPCMPRYKITIGVHRPPEGSICLCELHEVIHHSLDGRELFE